MFECLIFNNKIITGLLSFYFHAMISSQIVVHVQEFDDSFPNSLLFGVYYFRHIYTTLIKKKQKAYSLTGFKRLYSVQFYASRLGNGLFNHY